MNPNALRLGTWKVKAARRENRRLADALRLHEAQQSAEELDRNRRELLLKFIDRLTGCGAKQVGRHFADGAYSTVHVLTCKHRLCNLCNARRRKLIRAVWRHAYETHPQVFHQHDIMHIVLTVPHTTAGWRGKSVYDAELRAAFHEIRKQKFWDGKTNPNTGVTKPGIVAGGFYSTEFTRNNSGLHIHLHAIVFAHKGHQNRAELNRKLLVAWNQATTDPESNRSAFTANHIAGICKSMGVGTPVQLNNGHSHIPYTACHFIREDLPKLHPSGATMIHCENAYFWTKDKQGYKLRKEYITDTSTGEAIIQSLNEGLKYIFKPANIYTVEDRRDKKKSSPDSPAQQITYNVPLLVDILEAIQGKRLYGKFGDFYSNGIYAHIARLDFDDIDTNPDELLQATAAKQPTTNPNTGYQDDSYKYALVNTHQVRATLLRLQDLQISETGIAGYPIYESEEGLREALTAFNVLVLKPDIQHSTSRKYKREQRITAMHGDQPQNPVGDGRDRPE